MKTSLRLLSFFALLTLAACGGGGPGGGSGGDSISGTITAPSGVTVNGTVVYACYLGSCNSPQSKQVTLTAEAQSAPYTISGLEVGQSYSVVAVRDVNKSGRLDEGDDVGEADALVVVPARNVNVVLQRGRGSISGLLIFPGSVNPFGKVAGRGSGLELLDFADTPTVNLDKRNDLNANRPVEVVPGEVLVRFGAGVSAQSLQALRVGGLELRPVRSLALGGSNLQLYRSSRPESLDQAATLALVDALRARPDVVSAYPNWILHSFKVPNDEGYPLQWHYEAMNLPAAWDVEDGTSRSVRVAVLDTGAVGHPDLIDNLVGGYDFVTDPQSANDGDGRDPDPFDAEGDTYHGTHVAGTIAAQTNNGDGVSGVNWGAKIVPVRVLGVGGGTFTDILDGVAWAAGRSVPDVPANPNPVSVINLSLGGDIGQPCPDEVNQFFESLAAEGTIVVAAAGNENVDAANTIPASCSGLITVGATGPLNTRAPYSNYGAAVDVMATGGDSNFSFTADGREYPAGVLSTIAEQDGNRLVASYAFYDGTSMASPHIAGIVALMLAKNPGLSFNEVLTRLQGAATPLTAEACERPSGADCGAGLVDAAAALAGGGGGGPTPPPPPAPPPTQELVTYVAAFYCKLGCNDLDEDSSVLVEVDVTSDTVPYTISGLEAGTYFVAAWQDLDGDGVVDDREPFGVYFGPNDNPEVLVAAGEAVTNILVVMQPYTPTGQSFTSRGDAAPNLTSAIAEKLAALAAHPARRSAFYGLELAP